MSSIFAHEPLRFRVDSAIVSRLRTGSPENFTVEPMNVGLQRVGEQLVKRSVLPVAVTGPDPSPVLVPIVTEVQLIVVPPEKVLSPSSFTGPSITSEPQPVISWQRVMQE